MPDFKVPARYIEQHYEPDDRLAVVTIQRPSKFVKQEIRTAAQIVDDRYLAHLRAANAHNACIYVSINALREGSTGRTKDDLETVRHVFMDLDIDKNGKEAMDRIKADPDMPQPSSVIESSPGNYQALWKVEGFDRDQAEQTTRNLVRHFGGDPAAVDCVRTHRIPGFRNTKYEQPFYAREVESHPDRVYRPSDFPRYPEVERIAPSQPGRQRGGNNGYSQSHADFAYACRQLEKERHPDVVEREIADYRRRDGKHSDPDDYARRTVSAARARVVSRPYPSQGSSPSQVVDGPER